METSGSTGFEPVAEAPHPLAVALAHEVCVGAGTPRVLLLGAGNGRNIPPILDGRAHLDVVEEDPERARAATLRFAAEPRVRIVRVRYGGPLPFATRYDAALSTHALLHGDGRAVAAAVAAVRDRLRSDAPFYATFGSTADPRCGTGRRIDARTWAPAAGAEAGVAHHYEDADGVRALLAGFAVDALEERSAAATAGRWAHGADEAAPIVHWFVRARRQ